MNARHITLALGGRWHGDYGMACCPSHDDRTPSLSLRDGGDGRLLAHCHAGCTFDEVAVALRDRGLTDRERPNWFAPAYPVTEAAARTDEGKAARSEVAQWPAPVGWSGFSLSA